MKNKKNPNPTYELGDFEYKVGNIKRKIAVSATSTIVINEDLEMTTRQGTLKLFVKGGIRKSISNAYN